MIFVPLAIDGAFLVDIEPLVDERGFFARTYDVEELRRAGLEALGAQASMSYTRLAGTLRGLHLQGPEAPEAKLVRCTRGAVHDVIVDVRPGSPTAGRHVAVELSADNRRSVFVPPLVAHGLQTLVDGSEVEYRMGTPYTPGAARGLRYDDPALAIRWPRPVTCLSDRDRTWPLVAGDLDAWWARPAGS